MMVHFKIRLWFVHNSTLSLLTSALCFKNSKRSPVFSLLSAHQTKLPCWNYCGAQSATVKWIVMESSDWEVGSCLSRPRLMEDRVFSCCGLMRLCRVLRPHKQNPLAEKMPTCPHVPFTPPRNVSGQETDTGWSLGLQALAAFFTSPANQKVQRKRWHFSPVSTQISHTNKKKRSPRNDIGNCMDVYVYSSVS